MHCLWIGSSFCSKAIGSDPLSGLVYHVSCPKSLHGSTQNVPCLLLSKTCFKLLSETKISTRKSSLQLAFLHRKCQTAGDSASKIPPLSICMLPHLEKSKINLELIDDVSCLDIAPWTLLTLTVWFDLSKLKQHTTNPKTYNQFYLQLRISHIRKLFH